MNDYTNKLSSKIPSETEITDDGEGLPCAGKLAFDTTKQAQAAATVAQYQHGAQLKTYRCRYCHLWHLASDFPDS